LSFSYEARRGKRQRGDPGTVFVFDVGRLQCRLSWSTASIVLMPSPGTASGRRAVCPCCLRPAKTCLCSLVRTVGTQVELLILQHRLELANAKGTARLLHLCIPGSRLIVGERFDSAELSALLHADGRMPVLLYPDTPDRDAVGMPAPPLLPGGSLPDPSRLRLVVLDATWRKSRKMLYLNSPLHALPRRSLQAVPASQYHIRKAHAPDQLSTLEATCHALAQLDGGSEKFRPVLEAFREFVAMLAPYQTGDNPNQTAPERTTTG
jgi:DTW domain-containing protein